MISPDDPAEDAAAPAAERAPILDARSVGKRYGATVALQDVSFSLRPGEICGLLGENGAGKSTLVKILSGVVAADVGEIVIARQSYRPNTIIEARQRGVATAFQELSLVSTLSVAVNLFLPRPAVNRLGLIPMRRLEAAAAEILAEHGVSDIRPSALVGELSLGMRQRVEVVRAMAQRPRVLLLDEPTAALSDREWLFRLVDRMVDAGTSILYISHKLDEIRRLCRRCVILRNGCKAFDAEVADMSDQDIFIHMAGHAVIETGVRPPSSSIRSGLPPALQVRCLVSRGVRDISFSLAPGEVLGVAGLDGHGQAELFRALVGLNPLESGSLEVNGEPRSLKSPRAARRAGIVLVPEERKSEGIFNDLTTIANISLPVINRVSPFNLLHGGRERRLVGQVAQTVDLAERYLPLGIASLSGGNQQKTVLARALIAGATCLLLFDPTRGVDVGAKQSIYALIRRFTQEGGAILLYSTDLDELVSLCDRCLVIYRNSLAGELPRERMVPDLILSIASGHAAAGPARVGVGG